MCKGVYLLFGGCAYFRVYVKGCVFTLGVCKGVYLIFIGCARVCVYLRRCAGVSDGCHDEVKHHIDQQPVTQGDQEAGEGG